MQAVLEIGLSRPGGVRGHLLKDLEVLSSSESVACILRRGNDRGTVPAAMLNTLWCTLAESSQLF